MMADPKFANLPGIAYDQPDVYETSDVPEQETSDYYEEEAENEALLSLHISVKDSYKKFADKNLSGEVDFSDRLGKRIRRGYNAWSTEYVLDIEGEKEEPIHKCRRLQYEINELLEEVDLLQSNKKLSQEEKESYEAVSKIMNVAKKGLESLKIEQITGKEEPGTVKNEVKDLLNQVESLQNTDDSFPLKNTSLELRPSIQISKLEHRLNDLEKIIGWDPKKLSRLNASVEFSNLLEIVQKLCTKAALLQPNQLDLIEARLSNLVAKMDNIKEKTNSLRVDPQRDQKILELYEMAKQTEPIISILPHILERMQALESVHKYATNFSKIIVELEETQNSIMSGILNNKAILQGVQDAFAQNLENMQKEIKKLEQRMEEINSQVKK